MADLSMQHMRGLNPWWRRAEFILDDPYLAELELEKYIYEHPLINDFPVRQDAILTLRGPRQIGKTTLLMQIIKLLLLEEKVEPENVLFYPGDILEDFKELHELLNTYLDYIRPRSEKRVYIFIDEVSFVKGWQRAIKELADRGKLGNATLLITGSNILDLKFSSERMPGRRGEVLPWNREFMPLTFKEYLYLVAPEDCAEDYLAAVDNLPVLRKHLRDFLLTGGFPVTINEFHKKGYISPKTYTVFLEWIEGDLHELKKSEEIAYNIFRRLYVHLTSPVSFYKLTRESGLSSHATTKDYLDIFTKMFLLFSLPHFTVEQRKVEPRKNAKFYFTDPFIFNVVRAAVDGYLHKAFAYSKEEIVQSEAMPLLAENLVAAYLAREYPRTYFGQSKHGEVDVVGFRENTYKYYEVKYRSEVNAGEFKKLQESIDQPLAVVTRKDYKENGIKLIPLAAFLAVKDLSP